MLYYLFIYELPVDDSVQHKTNLKPCSVMKKTSLYFSEEIIKNIEF